ncbi:MAG: hypothetical protein K9M36_02570 [Candidatus Pacebacteria bacterium]|nr:hypothetical protein [Candidatus Paceibacterota bacterium]
MQIDKISAEQFKEIIRRRYGIELSDEEAQEHSASLLRIYQIAYGSVKKRKK